MIKFLFTLALVVCLVAPALGEDKSSGEFEGVMPWVTGSKREELKKQGLLQWVATSKLVELEGEELLKIESLLKSKGYACGKVLEAHKVVYGYPNPKTGVTSSISVGTWNPKTRKTGIYEIQYKNGKAHVTNAYTE